jgi:hypothetical protein
MTALDSTGVGKYMEKLTGDGRHDASDAAKNCTMRRGWYTNNRLTKLLTLALTT